MSRLEMARTEVASLEKYLRELDESDVIEQVQLEARLSAAKELLRTVELQPHAKLLPITFRGSPVDGTRSIDAGFAALAVKAFVDATDTVAASLTRGELADRGRLPGVNGRSLRIVDTAIGSFGFKLELPPMTTDDEQPSLPGVDETEDLHSQAITTVLALLDEAASNDEDEISDLIAEVHLRAVAKVRSFAKVLADHNGLFAAEFEGKRVALDAPAKVQRVLEALETSDMSEREDAYQGVILGILPEGRAYEARLADGRVVRGKIERTVEDIKSFKKNWENVSAKLRFRIVKVRSNERLVLTGASSSDDS